MNLPESYELWFEKGRGSLPEFLGEVTCNESELRELILTDQYLRQKAGLPYEPAQYTSLPGIGADHDFQLELWLEALGYAEQDGVATDVFLSRIPEDFRAEVRAQCSEPATSDPPIRPPSIERYRIDDELGRGAFGVVYRAWDQQLDRAVAVKVLRNSATAETDFAEARLIAGLDHPGLVAVYDCGRDDDGRGFLVTQLVDGRPLGDWAKDLNPRRLDDRQRICELFARLCDALAAAHQRGVVHRDLKPSNVLVRGEDQPVVLDFGLALSNWTPGREGEWVGTPAYMSPEQARGEGHLVDPRSDVFAVGILLFEVLTGERPWRSESTRELLREIAHGSVRSVRQLELEIPHELESICRKATSASMADRYGSAREMANDLRWLLTTGGASDTAATVRQIGARGLRPYTADDSESFWTLLPGYRNARGVPESVAWWLKRLQEDESEQRRGVLVLYGPSGSGKSSLLFAGVLPFLDSRRTFVCSLDASEFESATALASELGRATKLESSRNLSELVSQLRDRSSRHNVIAIDQFEQVLAWDASQREEIVFALRQADGAGLQFVLVVRDEFWSATSRLMRDLDAALRDDRNAMGLERFSAPHARHVLRTWGEAAPQGSEIDEAFVEAAVDLVQEQDRVIPVRLSLLACVLGEEPWTRSRLETIAQRGSLSARYLDSILGSESSPRGRRFLDPARRVLHALTPPTGLIRGTARSASELQRASGLGDAEFEDLVDLLDRRSHLITPVDRSEIANDVVGAVEYNLPHDFLVPELRQWLEEAERNTARGRAAIDLRSAARRWDSEQSSKQLAGPLDCLRFVLLAPPTDNIERSFLRSSAKRGLMRSLAVAIIAVAATILFQFALLRAGGQALVQRLSDCGVDQLPEVIAETRRRWTFAESPLRDAHHEAIDNGDVAQRDRFAIALLATEPEQSSYLSERALTCDHELLRFILDRMGVDLDEGDVKAAANRFASIAGDETYANEKRLRAAIAVATLQPSHSFWEQSSNSVCEMLVGSDPTHLGWMADGFWPVRTALAPGLTELVSNSDSEQLRTATFLLARFASDDESALVEILENALLAQLSAVAPTIRSADESIDEKLKERLEQRLDDYLDVAIDMEMQSIHAVPSLPEGQSSVLSKRRVVLARRIANLASLMLQRGCGEACVELLKSSSDPTLRSYLIQCYAISEGPAAPVAARLLTDTGSQAEPPDPDIAAAFLQILGSLPASSQVPSSIRDLALEWSRSSPYAELSASAQWYLLQQSDVHEIGGLDVDVEFAYRTSEGHTMIRLPKAKAVRIGASPLDMNQLANERPHDITVPESVYFSQREVSVGQFNRFLKARRRPLMETRSGSESATAMRVGFYQAAAYCNWLSDQEGIPREQWCFVPNVNGHYAAGMSVVDDHLTREGYQIPTADLWEYACRAGSETPRHYGYGIELSTPYVRWMGSRETNRRAVSMRKPNAFGLFDMLGNASEWSLNLVADTSANFASADTDPSLRESGRFLERAVRPGMAFGGGPVYEDASGKSINDRTRFLMLGGSFDSPAHKIRASDRSMVSPPITNQPIGIRLMRIVHTNEN